jgi:hypothetical protein
VIDVETRLRTDADVWRDRTRGSYPELDGLLPTTQQRRHSGVLQTLAVAAAVLALAAGITVIARHRGGTGRPPAATITSQAVPYPIGINGDETFQPLPTVPQGALTADQALAAYTAHRRHVLRHVPPGVQARFGILTVPNGSVPPIKVRTWQVWGYRSRSGCAYTGLTRPSPLPQCVDWDFVDAFTGRFVAAGTQELS